MVRYRSAKENKFGAVRTEVDGIKFDSKREARYYSELKLRVLAGEIRYFLRQVPLYLVGGVRYVVDFQEFHADNTVHYVDVKGMLTPTFIMKKKMVEGTYPIVIEVGK